MIEINASHDIDPTQPSTGDRLRAQPTKASDRQPAFVGRKKRSWLESPLWVDAIVLRPEYLVSVQLSNAVCRRGDRDQPLLFLLWDGKTDGDS